MAEYYTMESLEEAFEAVRHRYEELKMYGAEHIVCKTRDFVLDTIKPVYAEIDRLKKENERLRKEI